MTSPQRFRKKPLEIHALQWTGDNAIALHAWTNGKFREVDAEDRESPAETAELYVDANGRWLPVETGEWVLHDPKGFYPCKPDIFDATYNRVIENAHITGLTVTRQSVDEVAARLIEPDDADVLTVIRARAALIAQQIEKERPNPAELGYMMVIMSLMEAANQLRACAGAGEAIVEERADALDRLAEHAVTLGEAETEGPKR